MRHTTTTTTVGVWALLAMFGCAALPAASIAAPSVKMKARAVPIPRNLKRRHSRDWPHTGNILGHPAAVEAKISIAGSEYDGFPAPLRQVVVYLPKGTRIHARAFKTCPVSKFANQEPERCPKQSLASPPGEARGTVRFGRDEPIREKVLVQGYFAPHGGLTFWIEGRTPVQIERYAQGKLRPTKGVFGQRLTTSVPLIATVTGAPFASTEYIDVTVGAARMKHGRLVSYGTMPMPEGRLPREGDALLRRRLRFHVGNGHRQIEGALPAAPPLSSPREGQTQSGAPGWAPRSSRDTAPRRSRRAFRRCNLGLWKPSCQSSR